MIRRLSTGRPNLRLSIWTSSRLPLMTSREAMVIPPVDPDVSLWAERASVVRPQKNISAVRTKAVLVLSENFINRNWQIVPVLVGVDDRQTVNAGAVAKPHLYL